MTKNKIIKNITRICLVFLFFTIFAFKVEAGQASFFFSPSSESFTIEEIFSVELKIDTADNDINAAEASIYFPKEKVEVLELSIQDSIFSLWSKEPFVSDSLDLISFSGGLPQPGFNGVGKIITIKFKAREEGNINFYFDEGRILANDGKGTNILALLKEAKYSILKEKVFSENELLVSADGLLYAVEIFSSTHSIEEEWYNNKNPRFKWQVFPEIKEISFIIDKNPDTIPDDILEEIINFKNYENLEDGIWYFHLKLKNDLGWGETSHYKIQIDSSPPRTFDIVVDNDGDLTNPNLNLYFESDDQMSGVDYYKVKVEEREFIKLMSAQINPFSLSNLSPGRHRVIVRAADKAGNNIESTAMIEIKPIEAPEITIFPEKYIAGEEVLYISGTSLPDVEIIITLKDGVKEIKYWVASADSQGEWFFSTKDLIKSGRYSIVFQAKDKRGAVSDSLEKEIEILLSGLSFGPFIISLRGLVIILTIILLFIITLATIFIYRIKKAKKLIRKETVEARDMLYNAFNDLKREIGERIEMLDAKPGFNKKEKDLYNDLKKVLDQSEREISKEIKDIEREIK